MTPDQVQSLKTLRAGRVLKGRELKDQSNRTLMYGYTVDRLSVHVYLKDGVLHQLTYTGLRRTSEHEGFACATVSHRDESSVYFAGDLSMWLPSQRAYPEQCDFEFCSLLASAGVEVPFASFGSCPSDGMLPIHLDMPAMQTARLCEAFHLAGIETGSANYRATYENQALFNRIFGRFHFADVGAEPKNWIVLEDDLEALTDEIRLVVAGPRATAHD